MCKGKKIFKAEYFHCPAESTVHHKHVTDECGRFFITKTLQDASSWTELDLDIHNLIPARYHSFYDNLEVSHS